MTETKPLVILTGPTAVGKTALSIKLASEIGGEIISADSMQVYRQMDIGSAKIKPEEMGGIPHHLIDILEPEEEFNVCLFEKLALEAMEQIYERGHIPVVVGGTGFYIQALLYQIDFTEEETDTAYRDKLWQLGEEKGNHYLHELLRKVDPKSAEEIHENNRKRVIRALEFYENSGKPISTHNKEQRQKTSAYNSCYFVLTDDRKKLYERIESRVDQMLSKGLVDEVRTLKERGCNASMVSMQGLGYKEILEYLDGRCSLLEAVEKIKKETRHFAKRQLTWFRREKDVIWIDKQAFAYDEDAVLSCILENLRKKEIIK
ncbi:tRNA (adenosine(37)-N6)-dimethylallyltransferase MiaA [Suilimivivens aceti]|uniref:tRNA dimethylallyltransferase n=1 Tax=Suilimivivens aceti TaxID=2981774 RepID=A0ABT2SZA6_9FIRM|nr:tRNA (adenosine(37)-N6)-dimethylallyltransferase MiaA [Suilimivivens aceti]MCU6743329.1 tRNA (adenosine(37)-N6)-dimethylallyltransferase MiaA [Suilimivivens aceti]SCH15129.1 tRNA dimethylallyltransferase [uncultured Clostridium sp.]